MIDQTKREDIEIIQNYICKLGKPTKRWRKAMFDQLVYESWAAQEALDYICRRDVPTILALREFAEKMDSFSCAANNQRESYIFSVAYDTAEDIIEELTNK